MEAENDEYHLLGLSLLAAQRVELALYGLVAHASQTHAAQKDKRFSRLTPEKFLRGDIKQLKATLGQLVEAFGDAFLIRTPDLIDFYEDRNLIAHNYYRTFRSTIRGTTRRTDAREFLLNFLESSQRWERVLRGLLVELIRAAAQKEGRTVPPITAEEMQFVSAYHEQVAKHLLAHRPNE